MIQRQLAVLGMVLGIAWSMADTSAQAAAIAVSPDGKTVAYATSNPMDSGRIIYIVQSDTLNVSQRIWNEAGILDMVFTPDGNRLVVFDNADRLRLFDVQTWKPIAERKDIAKAFFSPDGSLAVVWPNPDKLKDRTAQNKLHLISLADGKSAGELSLPQGIAPLAGAAISPDNKTLILFSHARPNKETHVPPHKQPKLRGMEREIYRQKNDGIGCEMLLYDMATKKCLSQTPLWYSLPNNQPRVFSDGVKTFVLQSNQVSATITPDGVVTMFNTPNFMNHAIGWSADGTTYALGGVSKGMIVKGDKKPVEFKLPPLLGGPEILQGIGLAKDGAIYTITTASRMAKIAQDGTLLKVQPAF